LHASTAVDDRDRQRLAHHCDHNDRALLKVADRSVIELGVALIQRVSSPFVSVRMSR